MQLEMITKNIIYKFHLKESVFLRLKRVVLCGGRALSDEEEPVLLR